MALNDVPLAGQTLAVTRAPINQNFTTINTAFLVNHVEYGLADQGKHKFLQFPQQAAAPATAATELAMYTKDVTGSPQLFIRRQSSGTEIDFTSATTAVDGQTTLPSGITFKWNTVAGTGNTAVAITFTTPFTTACYNVQVTSNIASGGGCPQVSNITVNGFTLYARRIGTDTATGNYTFLAIGV